MPDPLPSQYVFAPIDYIKGKSKEEEIYKCEIYKCSLSLAVRLPANISFFPFQGIKDSTFFKILVRFLSVVEFYDRDSFYAFCFVLFGVFHLLEFGADNFFFI